MEKNYLTKEGYEELKAELQKLINVDRANNIEAIKEARALGDLSENADYDAARHDQALIEGKIQKLTKLIENCEIIEKKNDGKVGLGSNVSIKYVDDDEEDEYRIVGSQEANPFSGKISNESPIAKALFNKKVGDIVEVEAPNGNYKIEITEIN